MPTLPSDQIVELPDELHVTQYGEEYPVGGGFRDRLREHIGETEISMILGAVDASAAAVLVTGWLTPNAVSRVTAVGRLKAEGFRVIHSPTKRNRLHVSVYPPLTATGEAAVWDDGMAVLFNACFTEIEKGSDES
jgi:hypothetical protein